MPDTTPTVPSLLQVLTLNPARDADGRALLESAADQEALDEIRASYERCPYEDSPSRFEHEKPINVAALEQAKRNFAGMLAVLRHLREIHLRTVEGRELVAADWRRICISGEVLPRYLYLRHHLLHGGALDGYYAYAVPSDVSTLFKTVRGVAKVLDFLQSDPDAVAERIPKETAARLGIRRPKAAAKKGGGRGAKGAASKKPLAGEALKAFRAAPWTPDDLVWVAETFDLFVGAKEVCAAPTNMVRATLAALIDGTNPHDELELSDELKDLIGEAEGFVRFRDALDGYYRELRRFREKCARSIQRVTGEMRGIAPTQHRRALGIGLDGLERYLVPERRFLERCRVVQAELLDAAGYDEPPPPLGLDFIDDVVPQNRRNFAFLNFGVEFSHTDDAIEVSVSFAGETVRESIPYSPE